jgi:hypothetical protein
VSGLARAQDSGTVTVAVIDNAAFALFSGPISPKVAATAFTRVYVGDVSFPPWHLLRKDVEA